MLFDDRLETGSPSPVPIPLGFVLQKGPKIRDRSSSGMPLPYRGSYTPSGATDYSFGNFSKQNVPAVSIDLSASSRITSAEIQVLTTFQSPNGPRGRDCMRLSKEYYLLFHPRNTAVEDDRNCHFSADLIWAAIKGGVPLDADQTEHALCCRDCRQFAEQLSAEARRAGFSFPELLPDFKRAASA